MKNLKVISIVSCLLILTFVLSACSFSAAQPTSTPAPTDTPAPTATNPATPTNTRRPSPTPRPTKTPNLAATQKTEEFEAEAQNYFDLGYLSSADGRFREIDDFAYEWALLNYYDWLPLGVNVGDFYISAHFKWLSAYRNADLSGCGIAFAVQENGDHFAAFLDRSRIVFLNADWSTSHTSRFVGVTRGTGSVRFENPADTPAEADFTLIVKGAYAYVLVDGDVVGEYTMPQNRILKGDIGLSLLSGTNKDYGTRCEMTNIHMFIPN